MIRQDIYFKKKKRQGLKSLAGKIQHIFHQLSGVFSAKWNYAHCKYDWNNHKNSVSSFEIETERAAEKKTINWCKQRYLRITLVRYSANTSPITPQHYSASSKALTQSNSARNIHT